MKAKVISSGDIIEVKEWRGASDAVYSTLDMNRYFLESDLELLPNAEEVTVSGWVARDIDGDLYLYHDEPFRGELEWHTHYCYCQALSKESFPSLTWQDEPKKVTIKITAEK